MFVDLIGSSSIGNRLDPEDLMEVYRTYRELCGKAISAAGGHVARFIGDGILAYFGYPLAHENDPERAARAALDIVRDIGAAVTPAGNPLHVRIGIATGRVLVSRHLPAGCRFRTWRLAPSPTSARDCKAWQARTASWSRNRPMADPEQVCLRSDGRGRPRWLRGLPSSLAGARRTLAAAMRSPRRRAAWNSAFQGRRGELEVLRAQWNRAERGDGNVVLVMGEAGIGKSRLIDQFLDLLLAGRHQSRPARSISAG